MVLILLGQSCAGKDTILKSLVANYGFVPIISDTTRPMRENETDGVDYNFIANDEFLSRLAGGGYIEHRVYNTAVDGTEVVWHYGCPSADYSGKDTKFVIVLDVSGTTEFMDAVGKKNCFACYVDAAAEIREWRAFKRGSFDKKEWDNRLRDDAVKFSFEKVACVADFVINNTDKSVEETVHKVYQAFSSRLN